MATRPRRRVLRTAILTLVAGVATIVASPSVLAEWTGDVHAFLGQKQLGEGDWRPVDDQVALGVLLTFGHDDKPLRLAVDFIRSEDDGILDGLPVEGRTHEYGLGVRKIWTPGRMRPYMGGGLAFVDGERETGLGTSLRRENDFAFGLWLDGGILWRVGERFDVGLLTRYSWADLEFGDVQVDAGGSQVGLVLGTDW